MSGFNLTGMSISIGTKTSFGISSVRVLVSVFMGVCTVSGATLEDAQLTEFLASNGDGIVDLDGDSSDWIEILNSSGAAGDLDGWYLTDDPAELTKWRLPAAEIPPGGILWCLLQVKTCRIQKRNSIQTSDCNLVRAVISLW